jgi:hypothetical protein
MGIFISLMSLMNPTAMINLKFFCLSKHKLTRSMHQNKNFRKIEDRISPRPAFFSERSNEEYGVKIGDRGYGMVGT